MSILAKKAPKDPKKVVVSVGQSSGENKDAHTLAREIIQDARDEAFRIKKAAEEEAPKIHHETPEV